MATVYLGYEVGKYDVQLAIRVSKQGLSFADQKQELKGLRLQEGLSEHPNVLRVIKIIETIKNERYQMVCIFPYMPGGDFFEFTTEMQENDTDNEMPVALASAYFRTILGAVAFLHSQDIVHGDIKPENVLVGAYLQKGSSDAVPGIDTPDPAHLKLTDFGFAVRLQRGQKTTGARGTMEYAAPELLRDREDGRREYGHNVDCWAATVLFFTTLTYELPFNSRQREPSFYRGKISSDSSYKEIMPENMQAFVETVFLVHANNPEYCTPECLIQLLEQYQAQSGEAAYATSSSLLRHLKLESEQL